MFLHFWSFKDITWYYWLLRFQICSEISLLHSPSLPISQGHSRCCFYHPTEWHWADLTRELFLWITSCCVHEIAKDSTGNTGFLLDLQIVRYPKEWRKDHAAWKPETCHLPRVRNRKERWGQASRRCHHRPTSNSPSYRYTGLHCGLRVPISLYILTSISPSFRFSPPLNSFILTWLAEDVNHTFISVFTLLFLFFKLVFASLVLPSEDEPRIQLCLHEVVS